MILVIPRTGGSRILLPVSALGYFAFYAVFTGILLVEGLGGYSIAGIHGQLVEIASATYSGLAVQIVAGSTLLTIRLSPFLVSLVLSIVFGLNIALLWALYRLGGLRTCLTFGGTGGVGAILANLASFSYLCCGWAASLVLIGSTFLATLSSFISLGATVLLAVNALILSERYTAFLRTGGERPTTFPRRLPSS